MLVQQKVILMAEPLGATCEEDILLPKEVLKACDLRQGHGGRTSQWQTGSGPVTQKHT